MRLPIVMVSLSMMLCFAQEQLDHNTKIMYFGNNRNHSMKTHYKLHKKDERSFDYNNIYSVGIEYARKILVKSI